MSPSAAAQPKRRNVTVQQLEDVLKFQTQRLLALRRHVTHLMLGSDMSGNCEIKGDDVSCENDKGRRRTRALDASTTEAARGGLISHHTTDRKTNTGTNTSTTRYSEHEEPCVEESPLQTKKKQQTHSTKEQRLTINTFRCTDKRLFVTVRSIFSEPVSLREQPEKQSGR